MFGFLAVEVSFDALLKAPAVPLGAEFALKIAKCRNFQALRGVNRNAVAPAVLARPL
jgi:hypothetical protein